MRCVTIAFDFALKAVSGILLHPHWGLTLFAVVFVSTLLATLIAPDTLPPTDPDPLPLPIMLALYSAMFTGLAVLSWRLRVPDSPARPIPEDRLAEIQSWLKHRIDVDKAHEIITDYGPAGTDWLTGFDAWYAESGLNTDDLWYYDTPAEWWEQMWGQQGFALIRGGAVVDFWMLSMN